MLQSTSLAGPHTVDPVSCFHPHTVSGPTLHGVQPCASGMSMRARRMWLLSTDRACLVAAALLAVLQLTAKNGSTVYKALFGPVLYEPTTTRLSVPTPALPLGTRYFVQVGGATAVQWTAAGSLAEQPLHLSQQRQLG
jgi:hypothetical protein